MPYSKSEKQISLKNPNSYSGYIWNFSVIIYCLHIALPFFGFGFCFFRVKESLLMKENGRLFPAVRSPSLG